MAKVILTKSHLIALAPCDLSRRLALFENKSRLSVRQALHLGVSVADILWVAGALGLGAECSDFAQNCAERAARYADSARYAADSAGSARYAADSAGYAADSARYARYADSARYAVGYAGYAGSAGYAARYAGSAARYAGYAGYAARYEETEAQKADLIRIFG